MDFEPIDPPKKIRPDSCATCFKPPAYCLCKALPHPPLKPKLDILILQHPQEPDHLLGTARLAALALRPHAFLKIGLSWPNFKRALGREADPKKWAVLYLGSGAKSARPLSPGLHLVDKKGVPLEETPQLEGLVLLDGTWSQAKTLWWRNAWLMKLRRAVLIPAQPSLYGAIRKEPRKECLSTLETIAEALNQLQALSRSDSDRLTGLFQSLIAKAKAARSR